MSRSLKLFILLAALCCALADNVEHQRSKRGTRFYRVLCSDSCPESRCYNGGVCKKALYSSDFLCQCPPGYSGTQCEINTKERCVTGQGGGYRGILSISHKGNVCINWNSTSLRGKRFTAKKHDASSLGIGNHNYCRNPDNDSTPWCFVYKGSQVTWEFCSAPKCPENKEQECVRDAGQSYRGSAAVSQSGASCLAWDSPNPDGDAGPWCHVVKNYQLTWELCNVAKCSKHPITTITTLGPRAPTSNHNGVTCGQRLDNSLSGMSFRMSGGRESDIKDQPWQVAINVYSRRNKNHFHLCGGILIDSCWVLSAAHCFEEGYKASELQAVLGRTFRKKNSTSEQIFQIERFWVHQDFDKETFDNDIALLKLKTDIGICAIHSPEVLPACLPEPSLVLPDWTECEISGYGKDAEFAAEYSERVKRGFVRLWPRDLCVPEVLSGRTVTDNMLCAGDTRGLDDACKGDSGGPLVCPSGGRMTLMGVISWGDGCGKKDKPGVYTRVTHYLDWIHSWMAEDPLV
ncbi:hypothetical protein NHX12_028974 [Muraenolepis orangiensis]|uniref:Plasminogen activator n=1 Tax=Muraenolepis orangiensis TaxID=630683 RepID=A0A9Q0EER6_9TELE|nr:hypothetical protein NHX12_028974 [Muraenolepis orangiensis]